MTTSTVSQPTAGARHLRRVPDAGRADVRLRPGRRARVAVGDGHVTVDVPHALCAPIRVAREDVAVAMVPSRLRTTERWLAPLLVPDLGGRPGGDLLLLFREPVRMPELRLRYELDVSLPFSRTEVATPAGVEVDGLLLRCTDAAEVVSALENAGVVVLDDQVREVVRRRRLASPVDRDVARPEPPASHAAIAVALHLAVIAQVLAFWPPDRAPALAWPILLTTLVAAVLARPVLARREIRLRARRALEAEHRRAHVEMFG